MSTLLHRCRAKAMVGEGDQLRCGPNWVVARRAVLSMFDDHFVCGDWKISFDKIQRATLTLFHTPILRRPGYVLTVETAAATYHFGLRGGRFWKEALPFPAPRVAGQLRLSAISLIARLVLIGYLIYFVYAWIMTSGNGQ